MVIKLKVASRAKSATEVRSSAYEFASDAVCQAGCAVEGKKLHDKTKSFIKSKVEIVVDITSFDQACLQLFILQVDPLRYICCSGETNYNRKWIATDIHADNSRSRTAPSHTCPK